jgi:hypothetical protein
MFSFSHLPLIIGIALLAGAAVIIWRRPSENNPLTVMFLTGVALIFLSDQRIQNLKFGTSGVEVTRGQLSDAQEDIGKQIADLRSDVEKQKQLLDLHQHLLDARPAAPDAPNRPAIAPVQERVKEVEQKFAENSKYLILVFYRQGQRTAGEALSAALVEQGYKSSAITTDLTEVSIPGLSDPRPGTIVIARARQVPPALAEATRTKAAEIATKFNLIAPIVNNDEWPFRRGHIQVYMY